MKTLTWRSVLLANGRPQRVTGPCCMLLMTITKRKQIATHRMEALGALTTLDNLCSCPVSCFSFHPSLSARL